jgi:tetratricopeptide (TPR) repeat protein
MSQFRFARLALMLAAIGLNAAPALMHSAHAQDKNAQAAAQPKPDTVRPELFKLLDPAQLKPLMDAKNYTEVQNRVTQAEAFPDKTPYETYVLNRMKLSLATATGNDQASIAALEAILRRASCRTPTAQFTQALAGMYYNAKNYPKAIEWFKRFQAENPTRTPPPRRWSAPTT